MKIPLILLLVLTALAAITWLGLKVQPAPFAMPELPELAAVETFPLPEGLPAPVQRFYRAAYGGEPDPCH